MLSSPSLPAQRAALPPSPYGSPPIYMPFSAVAGPLQQNASQFVTSAGFCWAWYPFAPIVDAGWNEALHAVLPVTNNAYHELINYAMPTNTQDMIIPFSVEKVSPVLLLSGPMIVNTVDANPLSGLSFTVTNISTSLLAIQLDALLPPPDPPADQSSAVSNYRFMALVTVVG